MIELAKQQDGFLGIENAREEIGITVSYWRDLDPIKNGRIIQSKLLQGIKEESFSISFKTRITKVKSDYGFPKNEKSKY